jgi:hypothetical protein
MLALDPLQREVLDTVHEMNRAWTGGHTERLAEYFHPRMVALTPADARRLENGAACQAAWSAYAEGTVIHRWAESNPLVRVHGQAAVVAYDYELDCEAAGRRQVLRGRDLLFLVRENGRWLTVADQFSPVPA